MRAHGHPREVRPQLQRLPELRLSPPHPGASTTCNILLDDGTIEEIETDIRSTDPLGFPDYPARLKKAHDERRRQRRDPDRGTGTMDELPVNLGVMDFAFMGGSMGSVVGEKIARLGQRSLERKHPLIIVSASGGARMQEGVLSLMQMAKVARGARRSSPSGASRTSRSSRIPTTGGVSASYAMLGDAILAEPGAVIGFAGPRVIKQTLGQDLPEGFQTAEFLLDHGMLDARRASRATSSSTVGQLLRHMSGKPAATGWASRLTRRTAPRSTTCSRARPADPSSASSARAALLDALGDPHQRLRVAPRRRHEREGQRRAPRSTRSCARQGLRVGKYTSPHLVDFRERFLVDGAPVDEDDVVDFIERWTPDVERTRRDVLRGDDGDGVRLRSRARDVDVAVIETGLGGRLDSTNVVRSARGRRHVDRHRPHRVPRARRSRRSRARRRASSSRACRR